MSQLKTHQLAYRRYERQALDQTTVRRAQMLEKFLADASHSDEQCEKAKEFHKRMTREEDELRTQLDARIARLES